MDRIAGWVGRQDRRRASRPGSVVLSDCGTVDVIVTNLSDDGCQIAVAETLPIGRRVRLNILGERPCEATVRWAIPGAAGLQFVRPINHETV